MTSGQRNAHLALSELLQQVSLPDVLYALGEVLREKYPAKDLVNCTDCGLEITGEIYQVSQSTLETICRDCTVKRGSPPLKEVAYELGRKHRAAQTKAICDAIRGEPAP